MAISPHKNLWTIILAAGEGTRLRPLTHALHGEDLPKQFALIQGRQSLLQTTLARAAQWSSPERTVVIVAPERHDIARAQLRDQEAVEIVTQPRNLGTGPGVLLPVARILAEDPAAQVVILPSDHYVRDTERFAGSIRRADAAARSNDSVALIGAVADRAETQYGWIVTAPDLETKELSVSRFHEKPCAAVAEGLLREGALWNTFIMVAAAEQLWALGRRYLPVQTSLLESYLHAVGSGFEAEVLARIYDEMSAADFSRDVLEKADGLSAVPLDPCGWSDWGTPERVLQSLRGSADFASLLSRLKKCSAESGNPFLSSFRVSEVRATP